MAWVSRYSVTLQWITSPWDPLLPAIYTFVFLKKRRETASKQNCSYVTKQLKGSQLLLNRDKDDRRGGYIRNSVKELQVRSSNANKPTCSVDLKTTFWLPIPFHPIPALIFIHFLLLSPTFSLSSSLSFPSSFLAYILVSMSSCLIYAVCYCDQYVIDTS